MSKESARAELAKFEEQLKDTRQFAEDMPNGPVRDSLRNTVSVAKGLIPILKELTKDD